jgi:hypothetical protein
LSHAAGAIEESQTLSVRVVWQRKGVAELFQTTPKLTLKAKQQNAKREQKKHFIVSHKSSKKVDTLASRRRD